MSRTRTRLRRASAAACAALALVLAYAAGTRHPRHDSGDTADAVGTAPPAAPHRNRPTRPASTGSPPLRERILALLAENGATHIRDLRKQLPDVLGSSVSDALTELRGKGLAEKASHGVWQLPGQAGRPPAPEGDPAR